MLYSLELYANSNTNKKTINLYPQIKVVEKLTSDLDMCEFTTISLDEELNLDFKDYNGLIPAILKANGEEFKILYIANYRNKQTSYNPNKFSYVFQAVSPTFSLQRITLPNKLITQPITNNKRTVWEELIKIMEVYADNITINNDLQELMNIPCPELQFVKSTLHETLITLFAICGLVPKMEYYYYLSYINLKSSTNAKNWLVSDLFIRDEKSNTVQEYADALDFEIENAISDDEDITTQWIKATSQDVIVGTDNFHWQLPSDIYEIVKAELYVKINYTSFDPDSTSGSDLISEMKVLDITNNIVPKEIYDTFLVSASTSFVTERNYKRANLYYDKNIIDGATFSEGTYLGFDVKAIQNVVQFPLKEQYEIYNGTIPIDFNLQDILLRVTYKTQANGLRVKVVKQGIDKPVNTMISNQDEAYIDINNFGSQKQELINRMGNELYTGQSIFDLSKINYLSELNIANIGDRVDNVYIITERAMQLNENSLMINYKMAKDYVYLTSYSGLNQVKRFTSIDTKNTLIRNDHFLYNYKIELNDKGFSNNYLINKIINNYGDLSENGLNLHYVKTFDNNLIALQDYYTLVTSQNKAIADSVIVGFKFETNVKSGDSITKDGTIYLKEPLKYTDNNGEFKYLDLYFGAGEELRNVNDLEIVRKYPKVENVSDNLESESYLINKDNREITSINLQFRFVGDNNNVIVYNDFAKYTQLTPHKKLNYKIYAKYFEDEEEFIKNKYKINTIVPIGNEVSTGNLKIVDNNIKINGVAVEFGYWIIGIVDENNKLLLGVNYLQTSAISTIDLFVNKII